MQVRVDIQCQLETGFDHAGCSGLLRVKRYLHPEEGQSILQLVEMLARLVNLFQVCITILTSQKNAYTVCVVLMETATRAADLRVLHQLAEEEGSLHLLLRNEVPEVIHSRLHG